MSDNPLILQYSDGNLVPYQMPDPAQAARRALDFTGIPDLAQGANALARGEWLPGLGQAASGAAAMLPLGKLAGAAKLGAELMPLAGMVKAWHGTPHLFEPVEHNPFGEFRDAAIGTGTGDQVYGHGHYVAGNPAVAEEYQRNLQATPELAGLPLQNLYRFEGSAEDKAHNRAINAVLDSWKSGGSLDDAHKSLLDGVAEWGNGLGHQSAADILKGWIDTDAIKAGRAGSLLEVHILPDEHELLDWDKPLGEHPVEIQKKLESVFKSNNIIDPDSSLEEFLKAFPNWNGEAAYKSLAREISYKKSFSAGNADASATLHAAGIPGIKYLDQGSRDKIADVYHNGELHKGGLDMEFYSPKDVALSSLLGRGRGTVANKGIPIPDIDEAIQSLRREASPGSFAGFGDTKNAEIFGNAADWLHRERGNIEIRPPSQTSNYVIFDPKNLRIVGRNGQRLEPVDEDPFK